MIIYIFIKVSHLFNCDLIERVHTVFDPISYYAGFIGFYPYLQEIKKILDCKILLLILYCSFK